MDTGIYEFSWEQCLLQYKFIKITIVNANGSKAI